jgi:hypothetical protein
MIDVFDASNKSANNSGKADQKVIPTASEEKIAHAYAQLRGAGETKHPFQAFSPKPENTSFDFQLEQEEVLLLLRQHPITQVKWIFIAIGLVLLPFLFAYVPLLDFLPARFHIVAFIGWFLLVVGFSLEAFLDWYYNVYIVTNERIIDVDFHSLLFKNISTARLERIEDITVTSSGYWGSIFDFGYLKIQTAGATDEFEFEDVPHPNRVSSFINALLEADEEGVLEGK